LWEHKQEMAEISSICRPISKYMLKKKTINAHQAIGILNSNLPIEDSIIIEKLDLTNLSYKIEKNIVIKNSIIREIHSSSIKFSENVILDSSQIGKCSFSYAYFIKGLSINNCVFDGYLDFEAGGHNKKLVSITNSKFNSFVDFFDTWFQGEVIIRDNHFMGGSNLLGNVGKPYETQFDVPPIIENNFGKMDFDGDGEGDKEINIIDLR
jgi:hypothetical protein